MEKDDELKGLGNSYDFGARMLDPRIGRWFARDNYERKYPSNSTYSYALNSPLSVIDPDGNDIIILGNKKYRREVQQTIRDLYNSGPSGRKIVLDLISSEKVFVIVENKAGDDEYKAFSSTKAEGYIVFNHDDKKVYDPANGLGDKPLDAPPIVILAHEMKHAKDDLDRVNIQTDIVNLKDPLVKNPDYDGGFTEPEYIIRNSIKSTEIGAVEFGNQVRAELGLTLRTHYGGQNVFGKQVSEKTYDFGSGVKKFSTQKLVPKEFNLIEFNPSNAVKDFLNNVVESNNWFDVKIKSTLESNVNFGFSNDPAFPRPDLKEDKSLRLTIK